MRLLTGALALLALTGAAHAAAQYQTLHAFTGTDGDRPMSGLAFDANGNLYGTTPTGGAHSLGVVFRQSLGGAFKVLHDFKGGHDGATPAQAPLTLGPDGALYGVTAEGGTANGGTLYRITRRGKLKVLHSFGAGHDGYWPASEVRFDAEGNMTGTTMLGGTYNGGTIWRVAAAGGGESVLYNFPMHSTPSGTLAKDLTGNLYGVTTNGGTAGVGTIFELATDGTVSTLFNFAKAWGNPVQGLAIDGTGNLYGTSTASNSTFVSAVYRVTPSGNGKVLGHLGLEAGGTLMPPIRDTAGTLFSTTPVGGGNQTGGCATAGGCGMFYAMSADGTLTNLYGFGGSDGLVPEGGVISDGHGNYYGTTLGGGANHGTIFKITTGTP